MAHLDDLDTVIYNDSGYKNGQSGNILYMRVVRSTGSFITTVNRAKDVALSEKYLVGNQYFLDRKARRVSAPIASVQIREAAATYMPIHGIGPSSCFSTFAVISASPGIVGNPFTG